jgi:hypothetical protein
MKNFLNDLVTDAGLFVIAIIIIIASVFYRQPQIKKERERERKPRQFVT